MSTTTSKLGLIKPELSDSADITVMNHNWDRIDKMSAEDVGARPDDWMPTASDVGAIERNDTYIEGNLATFLGNLPKDASGFVTYSAVTDGPSNMPSGSLVYLKIDAFSSRVMLFAFHYGDFASGIYDKGTIAWGKPLKNYLPLEGGTLYDNLFFSGGFGRIVASSDLAQLEALREKGDLTNRRMFRVYSGSNYNHANAFRVLTIEGNTSSQSILYGEHNKPTGTYTGNGSATKRYISVGGIGNVVFITAAGYNLFVTPRGAFGFPNGDGTTITRFSSSKIHLDTTNNSLYIADTSEYFNASGVTYEYRLL